ncbi:MAG: glycosyltransferase family 4 protein [Canibacter sp.]
MPKLTQSQQLVYRVALVMDYSLEYLGGAQSAFLDEAEALSTYGHDVLIVAPGTVDSRWTKQWDRHLLAVKARGTIPVVDLPYIPNNDKLQKKLREIFNQEIIDIVHVHSEFGLAHAAAAAAHDLEIPIVYTVHTFFWEARLPKLIDHAAAAPLRQALTTLTGRPPSKVHLAEKQIDSVLRGATLTMAETADEVISPSGTQAETLRAAGIDSVRVVPNSAQHDEPAGEVLTEVTGALKLMWVGRLTHEKRILQFIEAVKIAAAGTDIEVTITGTGPLTRAAKKAAKSLPVTFTGRLSRADVQRHMRGNHLTVLTSYGFDNQPVTIVESIHARRPVLLCDPRLTEGLHGSGLYTEGPEPEQIAQLIVELDQNRKRVIQASQATVENDLEFQPSTHVAKLRHVYRSASQRQETRVD